MSVSVYRAANTRVAIGGTSVVAIYAPLVGGFITNPASAADQGLGAAELLFVDYTGPAAAAVTGTTFALGPGETASVPANDGSMPRRAATIFRRW